MYEEDGELNLGWKVYQTDLVENLPFAEFANNMDIHEFLYRVYGHLLDAFPQFKQRPILEYAVWRV